DSCKRCIDLVSNPRGQQTYGRKLLSLLKLLLQMHTIGHVFNNDQRTGHNAGSSFERSKLDVEGKSSSVLRSNTVLVDLTDVADVPSVLPGRVAYCFDEVGIQHLADLEPESASPADQEHAFHCAVPCRYAPIEVNDRDAYRNALDYVL